MRKVTVVRLGVAAALATMGVAGAVGSGCSNSSSGPTDGGVASNDGSTGATGDGSTGPAPDGSVGDSGNGNKDGGGQSDDAGPPVVFANVVVAHTAPGVPPFRVCFATGTAPPLTVNPEIQALPDSPGQAPGYPATGPFPAVTPGTPGIYPGTIGALPSATDFTQITLTPFAVLASAIANDVNYDGGDGVNLIDGGVQEDCVHLIGSHGLGVQDTATGATPGRLTAGVDYFPMKAIPPNTLLDNKAYLLTVNGCFPGASTAGANLSSPYTVPPEVTCGADYNADGGNVSIRIAELDTTTPVAAGGIGVQFAHRSTALEDTPLPGHTSAGVGVWAGLIQPQLVPEQLDAGPDGGDAGSVLVPTLLPSFIGDGGPLPAAVTYSGSGVTPAQSFPLSPVVLADGGIDQSSVLFGLVTLPIDGGAPDLSPPGWPTTDLIAFPFSDVYEFSQWLASTAAASNGFAPGQTYTFVLTGDPVAEPIAIPGPDGGLVANPSYDGRGLHLVAFPNVFTAQSL